MGLTAYRKKRDFNNSPEPQSGKTNPNQLIFVVQEHHASRHHFDFRLEMDGVLKSWAVPKGPSMDPKEKRLAIMTEDHPYDYKDFEGIIPKGNYGAGRVKIWDSGTYTPIETIKGKAAQEKLLLKQLREGSLKIQLNGKKLRGEFALVKTKGMEENAWLLIKHKEEAAAATLPEQISPMLATLHSTPFDDTDWQFEIKWDGYRVLAYVNRSKVDLVSRNGRSYTKKYHPITKALQDWGDQAILDGELVVTDENGIARFQQLQHWKSEAGGELIYYVFDLLWYKGEDMRGWPLSDRIQLLQEILPAAHPSIRMGFTINGRGNDLLESARQMGLEGIIAKRLGSTYQSGKRSPDWLKIKTQNRQEAIIVGYTKKEDTPKLFSALLLGLYKNEQLQYAGKVGTGFTDKQQRELMKLFKPLVVKQAPIKKPALREQITWLKPKLLGEISYTDFTEQGVFRHPSFKGLRDDKAAGDVVLEKEPDCLLPDHQQKTVIKKLNHKELRFTNLDKLFWPEEKITKRDLLNYYYQVAPYILPYLLDRPQSLYRFPDGYKGNRFYQKDVTGKVPDWATTFPYRTEGDRKDKNYLVVKDEASLLYMVNFGCIEINPWSSTVKKPEYPDWCLLDLDPGSKTTFSKVIDVANIIHELLESVDVPAYAKTSGSTGIHIYIPLGKKYTFEQSREFARILVTMVQQETNRFTSIERTVNKRQGKLYLDFLQNRSQATLAAPYSVRPKPGAPVSMPLYWEELKQGLKMQDFNLRNVPDLLKERGDIFKPVLGKGIDMKTALKRLQQL
ncbi:MAG: DNA ligase D [Flavipsychrobacter sp.]|jgi:bifunctional non-homologous end joining protein LigD|nr:DNA ligase D [Flavipsychrobacter sp.]